MTQGRVIRAIQIRTGEDTDQVVDHMTEDRVVVRGHVLVQDQGGGATRVHLTMTNVIDLTAAGG